MVGEGHIWRKLVRRSEAQMHPMPREAANSLRGTCPTLSHARLSRTCPAREAETRPEFLAHWSGMTLTHNSLNPVEASLQAAKPVNGTKDCTRPAKFLPSYARGSGNRAHRRSSLTALGAGLSHGKDPGYALSPPIFLPRRRERRGRGRSAGVVVPVAQERSTSGQEGQAQRAEAERLPGEGAG